MALVHDFVVETERPDVLAPRLAPLLEQYEVAGSPRSAYRILDRGHSRRGRWALYIDDDRISLNTTEEQLISMLLWHVNREAVRRTCATRLVVHAAAAERRGRAVILAAPMERGKTTTVTGLLQAGYRYLTDEAVAVDPESLLIDPFPKPLTLDRGSWALFPDLEPTGTEPSEMSQWHVPVRLFGPEAVAGRTPPALLVFPRYERGAATRLEPLRGAAAVEMLIRCVFHFADHPRRNLHTAAELVRNVPRYELIIGDLTTAVALIDDVMTTTG